MAKQQIILLYGGRSAERKVSVLSAESVMRAIDYDKFFVKTYLSHKRVTLSRRKNFQANLLTMKN